jgi:hypothetical protein
MSTALATSRFNDDRAYYRLPAIQRGQRDRLLAWISTGWNLHKIWSPPPPA